MIELVLPYPISANRYWASRVIKVKATGKWMAMTYVTPEAKAYQRQCAEIAARLLPVPLSGRVKAHAELYPHRPLDWQARMRKFGETWDDTVQCIDLGNAEKVMSDALQGIVFADDCQYRRIVLDRMEPDAGGERLVVRIEQVALRAPQADLLGDLAPKPVGPPNERFRLGSVTPKPKERDAFGEIPTRRKAEHAR